MQRNTSGAFSNVFCSLAQNDPDFFYNYSRMSFSLFKKWLELVKPKIEKRTIIREPISPEMRLAITLRYLSVIQDLCFKYFSGINLFIYTVPGKC